MPFRFLCLFFVWLGGRRRLKLCHFCKLWPEKPYVHSTLPNEKWKSREVNAPVRSGDVDEEDVLVDVQLVLVVLVRVAEVDDEEELEEVPEVLLVLLLVLEVLVLEVEVVEVLEVLELVVDVVVLVTLVEMEVLLLDELDVVLVFEVELVTVVVLVVVLETVNVVLDELVLVSEVEEELVLVLVVGATRAARKKSEDPALVPSNWLVVSPAMKAVPE